MWSLPVDLLERPGQESFSGSFGQLSLITELEISGASRLVRDNKLSAVWTLTIRWHLLKWSALTCGDKHLVVPPSPLDFLPTVPQTRKAVIASFYHPGSHRKVDRFDIGHFMTGHFENYCDHDNIWVIFVVTKILKTLSVITIEGLCTATNSIFHHLPHIWGVWNSLDSTALAVGNEWTRRTPVPICKYEIGMIEAPNSKPYWTPSTSCGAPR